MSDALTTKIAPLEELGSYGKYEAGPFAPGYGVTLGNALRRVLLGSLEGAAVTAVQIDGVMQEFSSLPGVREDVVQILLNVKKIRLRSFAKERIELTLSKKGQARSPLATSSRTARSRSSTQSWFLQRLTPTRRPLRPPSSLRPALATSPRTALMRTLRAKCDHVAS